MSTVQSDVGINTKIYRTRSVKKGRGGIRRSNRLHCGSEACEVIIGIGDL